MCGAGQTYFEVLKTLPEPARTSALATIDAIMRQLAEILHAAHKCGVVHRDLKPDNIMLVPDPEVAGGRRVKVIDFGIAKLAKELVAQDAQGVRTVDGALMGTPLYMSPEQCQGSADVGAPSDVYSYGVMFYQLLAGQPPFSASGIGQLIAEHLYAPPPPLHARYQGVPPALCGLVDRMLDKDPASRPAMEQVAEQLAQLSEGRPRSSEQPVHPEESTAAPLPKGPVVTTNGLGEHLRLPPPAPSPRYWVMLVFLAAAAVAVLFCALEIFAKARPVVGLPPPADLSQSDPDGSAAAAPIGPPDLDLASAADLASSTAAPSADADTQAENKQRHSTAKKRRKDILNAQIPFVQ